MDVKVEEGFRVELSKRNLDDLVAQVATYGEAELHRMTPQGFLQVRVVSDEVHYGDRVPGPGWLYFPKVTPDDYPVDEALNQVNG